MSEGSICPLSKQLCQTSGDGRDGTVFHSPFGGGTYFVTGSAQATLNASEYPLPRLMRWVYEQNQSGNEKPEITTYNLQQLATRTPLRATDRVRELLLYIRDLPSDQDFSLGLYIGGIGESEADQKVFAVCDIAVDLDQFMQIRQNAIEAGYLDDENSVTFHGHQYLEALEANLGVSEQAFVAMWFDQELTISLYENVIEPAVRRTGYRAFRVDKKEHANRIDDEIVGEIRRSKFLIADFSCPMHSIDGRLVLEHRGGVYFEAGLAQGLGLPVIWTCEADLIGAVHFDTRQYNHILWQRDTLPDFGLALERRIRAVVGQGPLEF